MLETCVTYSTYLRLAQLILCNLAAASQAEVLSLQYMTTIPLRALLLLLLVSKHT